MDAIGDFFDDMDRKRNRMEYKRDADQLESYLQAVQHIINFFEEGIYLLQSAHQQYASGWSGRSKESYESINNEMIQAAFHLYDIRDELYRSLHQEIARLRENADFLA
ncbi:hypothetical protein FZC66_16230 [Priestia megaterium]|nr:hypothetical protein FZC66_16230 [Priestia megaterium]